MTSYSFEISFNALAARLKEMRKGKPESRGIICAQIRGHRYPVTIAPAQPPGDLKKEYEQTEAGVLILRDHYCELAPYYDIFTLSLRIFERNEAE